MSAHRVNLLNSGWPLTWKSGNSGKKSQGKQVLMKNSGKNQGNLIHVNCQSQKKAGENHIVFETVSERKC